MDYIGSDEWRGKAANGMVESYIWKKDFESAWDMVNQIQHKGEKSNALHKLAQEFVKSKNFKDAIVAANQIPIKERRQETLNYISQEMYNYAVELIRADKVDEAIQVALQMTDERVKRFVFLEIMGALIIQNKMEKAIEFTKQITDEISLSEAFGNISYEYLRLKDVPKALEFARAIPIVGIRSMALGNIAKTYIENENLDEEDFIKALDIVLELMEEITSSNEKDDIYKLISDRLTNLDSYEKPSNPNSEALDLIMKAKQLGLFIMSSVFMAGAALGATEPGFKNLFNAKDLDGWDGNPKLWSVKGGAINGQTTAENPTKGNTFLIWTNGTVGDFELRCSFKIVANNDTGFANSGIQYRSKVLDPKNWVLGGYQADMEAGKTYTGILYEERMTRGIMAARGEKVVWGENCEKQITGSLGKSEEIQAAIKPGEWNDYVIIAKGNHLQHFVNGKQTVDVVDQCELKRATNGCLGCNFMPGSR